MPRSNRSPSRSFGTGRKIQASQSMDPFVVSRQGEGVTSSVQSKDMPKELKLENRKDGDSRNLKMPSRESQSEKFARIYRERKQRSRTSSPVLAKPVLSPKVELSLETLLSESRLYENVNLERKENNKISKNANIARQSSRKLQRSPQSRPNTSSKPNSNSRHHADVGRTKLEEKVITHKTAEEINQDKIVAEAKILGLGATKINSSINRQSPSPRSPNRILGSKVRTSLQDTVTSVRSIGANQVKQVAFEREKNFEKLVVRESWCQPGDSQGRQR